MKNFSDLLDIEPTLCVKITTSAGTLVQHHPLLDNLDFSCQDPISVKIDGFEVIEFGYQSRGSWRMTLHEPFYRWHHRVTGQGWLLEPIKNEVRGSSGSV